MIEAAIIAGFIYQAIVFFLLCSWKEAISYEAGEMTVPYVLSSIIAAIFWPIVVIWYLFTRKK